MRLSLVDGTLRWQLSSGALLDLERPAVVVSGDHFILRQPSPSATLGGGVILSPHPRRRWRRFDPAALARLQTLAKGAPDEVLDVQANIFAGMLLIPGPLLRKEVEAIDSSLDIVVQLADVFWVSKALMNQRLRDYMEFLT